MDFQSTNPLNTWLNLLSGNLLPITENSSFPLFWKIHSAFVWLLELIYIVTFVPAYFLVPKDMSDGLNGSVIIDASDMLLEYFQIFAQITLVKELIRKLNKALSIEDENMRHIVIMNLKPLKIPFTIYLVTGIFIAFSWLCMPFLLIFEKSTFYYTDYKIPAIFSKEPFSVGVFLLGNVIILLNGVYVFLRKASLDVYTAHLISLVSAQYQYVSLRLVLIFRSNEQQDNACCREHNSKMDFFVAKEIKKLCRQHIDVMK
ncbi:uncharacterized protein LOC118646088 [Monomorium pharaonis]|nr:uncharacterized protein LOC118646088 [Monomorium pharaonis]